MIHRLRWFCQHDQQAYYWGVTYYFYDLETTGFNPRTDRIMQFAGQRTDLKLTPIGQPDNFLIKLTPDVLPSPGAVMVHGITPQKTLTEGVTEAAAAKYLSGKVFTPDTITVGFNNIRFDDEFIRYLFWRNFTDAYEWHYKDSRSRWDLLDLTRMTRALRPEGVEWPMAPDGRPSNKLELLAAINKLEHVGAHDALSDVRASLGLAQLIRAKQGKLFDYLQKMRDKTNVAVLVGRGKPFIYTSGRYPDEFSKTTVAVMIAKHPGRDAALVYDLRIDPDEFSGLSPAQLAALWQLRGPEAPYFPVKKLAYNRSPAVAPLRVLDRASSKRLKIDMRLFEQNHDKLIRAENFASNILAALEIVEPMPQRGLVVDEQQVDSLLYEGFVAGADKLKMGVVRAAEEQQLSSLKLNFDDDRLRALFPLYKARNFPDILTPKEQSWWRQFRQHRLLGGGKNSQLNQYLEQIDNLSLEKWLSQDHRAQLTELKKYAKLIDPAS